MLTNPSATQDENAQDQHSIQVFDIEKISHRLEKLDRSEKSQRTILNKFDLEHDNGRRALPALSDAFFDGVAALKDKYPNCQVFLEFIAHFAHLSRIRKTSQHMRFPPVLLLGQPGVGKTAVVREIAELLNVSFKILDLSSTTAGFVIAGLSSSWSEAKTGNIVDLLRDGKTANPIVVLDEIDKTSRFAKFDPLGPLYTLLEADAARHFVDEALDMPCDASHVLFVATANDMDMISVPLLSRFVTMSIEMPNSEQQKAVAHSVYQSVLSQEGVTELFDSELPPAVLSVLSAFSPRQIKLMLVRAVAKASLRLDSQKLTQIDLKDLIKPLDERDRPVGFIW